MTGYCALPYQLEDAVFRKHVYGAWQGLEAGPAFPKINLHACVTQYTQTFAHSVCRAAMWHYCSQAASALGVEWRQH